MAVKGLQVPLSITASHFRDVPRGHFAFKFIETLYDYSTQSKAPFFEFELNKNIKIAFAHPNKSVSSKQAIKILSGLLKRNIQEIDKTNKALTRGQAAQLIVQFLN